MKTKLTTLTAILLMSAIGLVSCEGEEKNKPFLTIDETPIIVTAEGGTYYIAVSSNGEWTTIVENSESWITLTTNNDTIVVDVDENTFFESRSATVKITLGSLTKSVVINQWLATDPNPCNCTMDTLIGEWRLIDPTQVWPGFQVISESIMRIFSRNEDGSVNYEVETIIARNFFDGFHIGDTYFYRGSFQILEERHLGVKTTDIKFLPPIRDQEDTPLNIDYIHPYKIEYVDGEFLHMPTKNFLVLYSPIGASPIYYIYKRIK